MPIARPQRETLAAHHVDVGDRSDPLQPVTAQVTQTALPDDAGLVQRARAGDAEAFDEIAAVRLPGAFRLASAILGSEADAADAAQNAFLAAWRQLPQLRELERFDAWLHRIVVNECRMRVRQQTQRREVELVDDASSGRPGGVGMDTSSFDAIEILDLLEGAFESLDADDRTLVVLHHLEDRPLDEIAAIVDMPVGTVKWRLHEARKVLHGALEADR
jgi:RNA polymerase sigma-70 factor (ECF subfamily)